MSPSIILHQATESIFVAYPERELTFEVNLPTNLGELTFKNTSKWAIDQFRVVPVTQFRQAMHAREAPAVLLWREEEAFMLLPQSYYSFVRKEAHFIRRLVDISQVLSLI